MSTASGPEFKHFSSQISWAQLSDRAIGLNAYGGLSSRSGHAASVTASGLPCCVRELGPVGSPAPPGTPGGGDIAWAYASVGDEMVFRGGTSTPPRHDWALFFDRPGKVGFVASANSPVVGGLPRPDDLITAMAAGSTGHVWFNGLYNQDEGGLFWAQRIPKTPALGSTGLALLAALMGVTALVAGRLAGR
ncbi:MAG: hypothetical protein JRH16_23345 [Deltaproteobacteria bacterium]|nr:hypothetical protein [Deltaproteobacteria bacterium]